MKICITGIKGSGKSTFMKIAKEYKCNVYITDDYIYEIYKINNIGYKKIYSNFGIEYIENGCVNRKKLNQLVVNNQQEFNKLNSIMIPIIRKWIKKIPKNQLSFIELGTYLIFENEFSDLFDKVVLIKPTKQINFDNNHVSNKLNSDNIKHFDAIIENDFDYDHFLENVKKFLNNV